MNRTGERPLKILFGNNFEIFGVAVAFLQMDLTESDQMNETVDFNEINNQQGRGIDVFPKESRAVQDMFR